MKTKLCILCCLIINLTVGAQVNLDSLHQALLNPLSDSARMELLFELNDLEHTSNPQHAIGHSREAVELAEQMEDSDFLGRAFYELGIAYYYMSELDSAELAIQSIFDLKDLDQANPVYIDAHSLMGSIFDDLSKYEDALQSHLTSLSLAEAAEDSSSMARSYNNIGVIYHSYLDEAEARPYFYKALRILLAMSDSLRAANVMNNISLFEENPDTVLYYLHLANDIFTHHGMTVGVAYTAMNIGSEYGNQEKYSEALPWIKEALGIFSSESFSFAPGMISGYINLGAIHGYQGDLDSAKEWFDKAIDLCVTSNNYEYLKDTYEEMVEVYETQAQSDSALTYAKKLIAVNDTLYNRARAEEIANYEVEYQTHIKDKEIATNQLVIAKQQSRQRVIFWIGLSIVLGLLGYLVMYRSLQKQKEKQAAYELKLRAVENDNLKEMDRVKSNFFSNISHEFRTPITLMLSPIDRLSSQIHPSHQKYLDIMRRSGNQLLRLVNQLLDLSKLESNQMSLLASFAHIPSYLRRAAYSFQSMAENKQINYQVDIDSTIDYGWLDEDKMNKILENLLSNAFKFTRSGDTISFKATRSGDHLAIEVRDSGMGIAADKLDAIWDRFYQIKGIETFGTGIGLALVKECIELHKGTIHVTSVENQFTEFKLRIPITENYFTPEQISEDILVKVATSAIQTLETGEAPIKLFTEQEQLDHPLILIVEDQIDLQFYISEILQATYRFVVAQDGVDGLEKAIQYTPNLIISDVMMPHMDGLEMLQQLRLDERTSHIPLILLTAKSGLEDKLQGLQHGADEYITKPFVEKELLVRIDNLLARTKTLQAQFETDNWLDVENLSLTSLDQQFVKRILDVISENLDNENFGVETLSQSVLLSRSQLHRKLKNLTSLTPTEMIRNYRLHKAKRLLESKSMTISEVAFSVGYKSLSHFSDSFKKYFDRPPSFYLPNNSA